MAANQYNRKPTEAELVYGTYIEPEFRRSTQDPEFSKECGSCGKDTGAFGPPNAKPLCRRCGEFFQSIVDNMSFDDSRDSFFCQHNVPTKRGGLRKMWFEFDGRFWWQLEDGPTSDRRPGIVKNARTLAALSEKLPRKPEREVPVWSRNYKIPVDHTPKFLPGYNEFGAIAYKNGVAIIDCDDCNNHEHWDGAFGGCSQHGDTCQLCCDKKAE